MKHQKGRIDERIPTVKTKRLWCQWAVKQSFSEFGPLLRIGLYAGFAGEQHGERRHVVFVADLRSALR